MKLGRGARPARRALIRAAGCAIAVLLLAATAGAGAEDAPRAAAFRLPTADGRGACSLEEKLVAGPAVVVFWRTCCAGTEVAMLHLQRLYETYHPRGLEILAVCANDSRSVSQVKPWVVARRLSYPVLVDPRAEVLRLYQVVRLPHFVFVDREGFIRYRHEGFMAGDEERLDGQMAALLAREAD